MKKIILIISLILAMIRSVPLQSLNNNSSIEAYSTGTSVSGDCLAKYVELSQNLKGTLAVKNGGLGFIENDDFFIEVNNPIKYFEIIDDLDDDEIKDVVLYVEVNNGYSNLLVVSSRNSKILYEKAFTHENYDEKKGVFTENSIIR